MTNQYLGSQQHFEDTIREDWERHEQEKRFAEEQYEKEYHEQLYRESLQDKDKCNQIFKTNNE